MNKIWSHSVLALLAITILSACGKKTSSSGNSNNCNSSNNASNPNCVYQQPQYSPPNINWNNQPNNYVPTGNCGQSPQMPSSCNGSYNGYSYCGNLWYYQYGGIIWSFPSGSGGCNGGVNNQVYSWWDDYNSGSGNNNNSSYDNNTSSISYNSGWKKVWGIMGSSENRYIVVTVPSTDTYYLSFKGDYTGKKQNDETLKIKFDGGNSHTIDDLEQTKTGSGEATKSCKVNINYKLKGGKSYKIYLSGKDDSVNNTYLRLTTKWPSDTTKLCH